MDNKLFSSHPDGFLQYVNHVLCVQTVHLCLEKGLSPVNSNQAPLTPQPNTRISASYHTQTKDKEQPPEAKDKPEYSFVTQGKT